MGRCNCWTSLGSNAPHEPDCPALNPDGTETVDQRSQSEQLDLALAEVQLLQAKLTEAARERDEAKAMHREVLQTAGFKFGTILVEEHEHLRALLLRLEWSGSAGCEGEHSACPLCKGVYLNPEDPLDVVPEWKMRGGYIVGVGHVEGCELAAALREGK